MSTEEDIDNCNPEKENAQALPYDLALALLNQVREDYGQDFDDDTMGLQAFVHMPHNHLAFSLGNSLHPWNI